MAPVLYIVVPCYNEQAVLPITAPLFLKKLESLAEKGLASPDSRVLFVDDGSRDATWDLISDMAGRDERVLGVRQSRNRGHQNAVLAGLMEARERCDVTISIDCDGQDDLDAMDRMLEDYAKGSEVVYGVRDNRDSDSFFKRTSAQMFYKFLAAMGAEVVYNHADYRLLSARVLKELADFHEVNLYLRGLVPLVGFKSSTVSGQAPAAHHELRRARRARELHRRDLGAGDGAVRQGRPRLGEHDLHRLLRRRRAAREPRHHRGVHRQDLHGGQAPPAVHHQ